MRSLLPFSKHTTTAALTAALLAATALTTTTTPAFAVPPGGYADLVEEVSPAVVFIEVEGVARAGRELPQNMPPQMKRFFEDQWPDRERRGQLRGTL